MTENLKKFLEAASGDAELAEKVSKAKSGEEIAELAKTLGFTLTEEDFKAPEGEISDDELEGVAGGAGRLNPVEEYLEQMMQTIGKKKPKIELPELPHFPKACACYHGAGGA